jgi:galactokinase
MDDLKTNYIDNFGKEPTGHVRSPLRVCPLGAHVDHQDGLVTGMAVNEYVDFVYDPDDAGFVRVQSLDFPDEDYFGIEAVPGMLPGFWGNYLRGSVLSLARDYKLRRGLSGVVRGKLPMGGLSSSAAVTTAYLLALCDVNGIDCSKEDLIQYSHWVEKDYIGLKNGILDQSANVLSKDGYLMSMDCATGKWELVPKGDSMPAFSVVIVNSGFNKALIGTDYNNRVDECKIAASVLQELTHGKISAYRDAKLRNIDPADWAAHRDELPGRFGRRAKHFFTEIDRVRRGVEAWKAGDLAAFGRLMVESGESSVHDYECGCPELITIFDVMKTCPGIYGARFSGAGYRGCCIGLADPSAKAELERRLAAVYPVKHPQFADKYKVYFCKTADGAAVADSVRTAKKDPL